MKRISQRILIILVSFFALSTTVFASDFISPRASLYISGTDASIQAGSNGKITIYFSVTGTDIMTQIGASTIYLYEDNGSTQKVVKTFRSSNSEYSNMMSQNTSFYGDNVTYYDGVAGYKYHAEVYLKAANGIGSDTVIEPTNTVTARK